ncbi:MAG: hypothetical protein AB7R90_21410 [Reyranellaceae bacterium]
MSSELPIDPKARIAFTPPHLYPQEAEDAGKPKPVIWLRPMSVMDRARWKAALAATGSRTVPDSEMAAARREIYAALEITDAEADAFETLYDLHAQARSEGRDLEREQLLQLAQIDRMLVDASDHYRFLTETRALFVEVGPLLALQLQCVGWSHMPHRSDKLPDGSPAPAKFERSNGRVSEAALDQLDPLVVLLAGFRAMGLGNLSEGDAKKSA